MSVPTLRKISASSVASVAALVWTAASAHAQTGSDAAVAQALYDEARALMAQGRAREACPKLEESQRIDPGSGTLINLALCYEKLGRYASAWNTYLEAAAAAHATGNFERENGARDYAYRLAPRVSRLRIDVPATVRVRKLHVLRDGIEVGEVQWGVELPADDGLHTIQATAPGHAAWQTQVLVAGPHGLATVAIPLLADETSATAEHLLDAQRSPALGSQRVAALAVGGVGAVGLTVSGVFSIIALSKKNQASHCDGNACDTTEDAAAGNAAHSAGNVATIAAIVGAAGVLGGVALWFTAPKREQLSFNHIEVGPRGVRIGGTF